VRHTAFIVGISALGASLSRGAPPGFGPAGTALAIVAVAANHI
jgi:hypothetical protein